jgi:hypothetical protein
MTGGCLIAPPDRLDEPDQIPPSVFMDQVTPSLLKPVLTYSNPMLNPSFSAPFVSEDLGEDVWGRLYLNYNTEAIVIGRADLTASNSGEPRTMTIEWTRFLPQPAGCHSVTMAISHEGNFENQDKPAIPSEAAFVTWWVSHDSALQDVTLSDCDETAALAQ